MTAWNQLDLRRAPKYFLRAAAQELRRREERPPAPSDPEEAFDYFAGATEYIYFPARERFATLSPERAGVVRCPAGHPWAYVRVPSAGGYRYWRHRTFTLRKAGPSRRLYQHIHSEFGPESSKYFPRYGTAYLPEYWVQLRARHTPKGYTVAECRRQLQRCHPDKGGAPSEFQLWRQRLEAAKRAAS